jgi:kynureninase
MSVNDPLLAFRGEFPILDHTNYLVSNSLGASRVASGTGWRSSPMRGWNTESAPGQGWWEMPGSVGDAIAPLIGAGPGEVVMVPNVTLAQATVLSAVPYRPPRNRIVMTALDFPSVRYLYDALATRLGAEVHVVPSDDGVGVDEDRVRAAIDERTALVSISHVLFKSAHIMDVARITRHAHDAVRLLRLDAFHSVGVMPVDVKRWRRFPDRRSAEMAVRRPAECFMYASPEMVGATRAGAHGLAGAHAPLDSSRRWSSRQRLPLVGRYTGIRRSTRRSKTATDPEGRDRAIRAKSIRQTRAWWNWRTLGAWSCAARPSRRGGRCRSTSRTLRGRASLLERDILVDFRPGAGIRVAPHFYTRDDELEDAVSAIDEILATGAWSKHEGRSSVVT